MRRSIKAVLSVLMVGGSLASAVSAKSPEEDTFQGSRLAIRCYNEAEADARTRGLQDDEIAERLRRAACSVLMITNGEAAKTNQLDFHAFAMLPRLNPAFASMSR